MASLFTDARKEDICNAGCVTFCEAGSIMTHPKGMAAKGKL